MLTESVVGFEGGDASFRGVGLTSQENVLRLQSELRSLRQCLDLVTSEKNSMVEEIRILRDRESRILGDVAIKDTRFC